MDHQIPIWLRVLYYTFLQSSLQWISSIDNKQYKQQGYFTVQNTGACSGLDWHVILVA